MSEQFPLMTVIEAALQRATNQQQIDHLVALSMEIASLERAFRAESASR